MSRSILALLVVPALVIAAHAAVDRDPSDYVILAVRRANLKDIQIAAPGCSVGVNCPQPGRSRNCGAMRAKGMSIAAPGQAVADDLCSPGTFFTVFRNNDGECSPGCADISDPGPGPTCGTPLVGADSLPIIGDLDGDLTPSCNATCEIDRDDIARACGVTLPLPPCDKTKRVIVRLDQDCDGADDIPGNFRCDLPAGTYGAITVQAGARLNFAAGTTVVCGLKAGKAARVSTNGPATVLVPGKGKVRLNNNADVGTVCGELRIIAERGTISFGRRGDFLLDACSIQGRIRLGHSNNLQGHFLADGVFADRDDGARCCEVTTTTTTTTAPTTSTTGASTTSTTGASTTSTTGASTTSTTGASTTSTTGASTSTTSTTGASSTTTSTLPGTVDGFTRTSGFYKNHPEITAAILASAGPFTICGQTISDIDIDHAHSALEAMCISPQSDQRLQLARQLTAAALTMEAGGATFVDFVTCNAICADAGSPTLSVSACIDETNTFNLSGDNVVATFDPVGNADSGPCQQADATACVVLDPGSCAVP
jgi:hypothetical protein